MKPSERTPGVEQFNVVSSQRTVLQVEDNEANASLITQLLAQRGDLALLTAVTGFQGLEMAIAHLPDVILLDIVLPDIGGNEVFAALRSNPLTCHIPVIALSSNAFHRQIQEGLEAGFFRYLTKPFKLFELMNTIDLALDPVAKATTELTMTT